MKEPSRARSQGRPLRGALGPQNIQVVAAFSPGKPQHGCGNEPLNLGSPLGCPGSRLPGSLKEAKSGGQRAVPRLAEFQGKEHREG